MNLMKTIFLFFLANALACDEGIEKERHLFYLHGRIIELQGKNAISERFGSYEYDAIIDQLEEVVAYVHHEIRPAEVDFQAYCQKVSGQIDHLISSGVSPGQIIVLGASKGAVMAMQISAMNEEEINYVLLGANNDYLEQEQNWSLHGRILGIYEHSDDLAGKNYQYWMDRSSDAIAFEQLELNTGLGHGFIYQPLSDWLDPLKKWIK